MASSCSSSSNEVRPKETTPFYIIRHITPSTSVEFFIVRHEGCGFFRDLFTEGSLHFEINSVQEVDKTKMGWRH